MGDILKEAIADAKAVRETALENAKMALEEAFTPQLKSMLSAKLREDEDEEEFGGEEEEGEEEPEEMMSKDEISYEDEEAGEEEPEFDDEGGEDAEEMASEMGDEEDMEEEGLDLESIIKELETEIEEELRGRVGLGENEDEDEDKEEVDEIAIERNEGDPSGPSKDGNNSTNEDVDIDIDEAVIDENEDEDKDKEEVDEEVDETSGIGSGTGKGNTDRSSGIGTGGQEKSKKMESVEAELAEYKEAVSFLKDKLHEVNILNAKLLFTNKLFKEFALDNNQKLKVVETFDRTQTTREIKLVYSTLCEQFSDNGSILNKKSINESASSAVSSTKPSKESRKVITEESQVADRFRKLAGLIK